jgi:hypothetical protein
MNFRLDPQVGYWSRDAIHGPAQTGDGGINVEVVNVTRDGSGLDITWKIQNADSAYQNENPGTIPRFTTASDSEIARNGSDDWGANTIWLDEYGKGWFAQDYGDSGPQGQPITGTTMIESPDSSPVDPSKVNVVIGTFNDSGKSFVSRPLEDMYTGIPQASATTQDDSSESQSGQPTGKWVKVYKDVYFTIDRIAYADFSGALRVGFRLKNTGKTTVNDWTVYAKVEGAPTGEGGGPDPGVFYDALGQKSIAPGQECDVRLVEQPQAGFIKPDLSAVFFSASVDNGDGPEPSTFQNWPATEFWQGPAGVSPQAELPN